MTRSDPRYGLAGVLNEAMDDEEEPLTEEVCRTHGVVVGSKMGCDGGVACERERRKEGD